MPRPTPPTVHVVLLTLTVLMALVCGGASAGLFAGREALCDYFEIDLLLEYEGIVCNKEPRGTIGGRSAEQTGAVESPPAAPVDQNVFIGEGSTFGVPEVTPLDGEPESVASGELNLGEGGGTNGDTMDDDDLSITSSTATLAGIACVGRQLMVSFEFHGGEPDEFTLFVGNQPFLLTPVPTQPTRLYFLGAPPAQDTRLPITLAVQPPGATVAATVLSETYTIPACGPAAASAASAQPNCPPPEFFDPLMDRCRIVGNEQPDEAEPSDDYTPPGE